MIEKCDACVTYRNLQSKEPLLPHNIPHKPWNKTAMYLFNFVNRNYLMIVNYYTKIFEIIYFDKTTSSFVINFLKSVF